LINDDRFLGEREEERKAQGAYYTPMYLADTVVSQFWEFLPVDVRFGAHYGLKSDIAPSPRSANGLNRSRDNVLRLRLSARDKLD
jgi:hypothetical protein